jgi:monovalent cation:H+ antiporter-2, CPA2 family
METPIVQVGHGVEHAAARLGLMGEIALVLICGLIGGLIASRLRLPPLVGFLVAGIAVGPYTPGFIADTHSAEQLGEIGVVLLMFGVGLHFSLRDLAAVRNVAIPGAILQSVLATVFTVALAATFGWGPGAGMVLGLALSVASTVVLVRALIANDTLGTQGGRVAIGWLVVEDLFSAFVLVLLPVLAVLLGGNERSRRAEDSITQVLMTEGDSILSFAVRAFGIPESVPSLIAVTVVNVLLVIALMYFASRTLVPWFMGMIERTGSEELLTVGGVVAALFVAFGTSAVFGLSVAIGAFFAGIVVGTTPLAHRIGEDVRPLRDLFGVLFFASVGMLFDPFEAFRHPLEVLAVLLVVLVVKPVAAALIALALRQPWQAALTVAPGLAQIGEFSFILATLGRTTGLLPEEGYQLVITGAIISIALNPLAFRVADMVGASRQPAIQPA